MGFFLNLIFCSFPNQKNCNMCQTCYYQKIQKKIHKKERTNCSKTSEALFFTPMVNTTAQYAASADKTKGQILTQNTYNRNDLSNCYSFFLYFFVCLPIHSKVLSVSFCFFFVFLHYTPFFCPLCEEWIIANDWISNR